MTLKLLFPHHINLLLQNSEVKFHERTMKAATEMISNNLKTARCVKGINGFTSERLLRSRLKRKKKKNTFLTLTGIVDLDILV